MNEGTDTGEGAMEARAELVLQCSSSREAGVLWDALRADDPGSVEGRVEDDRLYISAGPATMPTLRATLDDLLACAHVASGAAFGDPSGPDDEVTVSNKGAGGD